MNEDYILIAIDPNSRYAIRFLSLQHALQESLALHRIKPPIEQLYAEFVMGSVLLGSRSDEQITSLFKLALKTTELTLNCEVAPTGMFRSAVFPFKNKDTFTGELKGELKVIQQLRDKQNYQSLTEAHGDVITMWRNYLSRSMQADSLLFLHFDPQQPQKTYGLWVERLPDTEEDDFNKFASRFKPESFFTDSFKNSDDPDQIINHLFPEGIKILAVTKPRLLCSCSKQRIIDGLATLPKDDLVELFMDGQGIETQCDYCHKIWSVSDLDVQELIKGNTSIH